MLVDLTPFRNLFIYLLLMLVFHIGWVIKEIPFINRVIVQVMDRISGICMPVESYWDSLFSWKMLATVWRNIQVDLNKNVTLGESVPDVPVVLLGVNNNDNEAKLTSLLSQVSRDRPFVMNFGCLTCPIFTTKMKAFSSIVGEFGEVADFVVVYIEEAHPDDGWQFKSDLHINTHRSIKERIAAAQHLQRTYDPGCPVLVDSMLDAACMSYGAAPIRLHVVKNGILEYIGGPGPFMYDLDHLRKWLLEYKKERSN